MKPITIKIERYGINGEGIGFSYGKPIFIDGALKDEVVSIKLTENNARYGKGQLMEVIKPSNARRKPLCGLYRYCDGCPLMHCKDDEQALIKTSLLKEALYKYGPTMDETLIKPIITSDKTIGYRNSCKLYFGDDHGKIGVGLYRKNSHTFTLINDRCIIHEPLINTTINKLLKYLNAHHIQPYSRQTKSGLRGVSIRVVGPQVSMVLVASKDVFDTLDWQALVNACNVTVMASIINTKREIHQLLDGNIMYHTKAHQLKWKRDDMVYTIRPQAFFQLNTFQLTKMIDIIKQYILNDSIVFEGYCGIGILGMALSTLVRSLDGVEIIDSAIMDAKANAKLNGLDNYHYYCGDSASWLYHHGANHHYDVVLVDPPRSGLDANMVKTILKVKPQQIIYISCNPVTLAKDLHDLSKGYSIQVVQPLDMFPNTQHVETIVVLSRK